MDARSIAATAANGGRITPATDVVYRKRRIRYRYDRSSYEKRCYNGFGKADPKHGARARAKHHPTGRRSTRSRTICSWS
jgi:hypothetical protein